MPGLKGKSAGRCSLPCRWISPLAKTRSSSESLELHSGRGCLKRACSLGPITDTALPRSFAGQIRAYSVPFEFVVFHQFNATNIPGNTAYQDFGSWNRSRCPSELVCVLLMTKIVMIMDGHTVTSTSCLIPSTFRLLHTLGILYVPRCVGRHALLSICRYLLHKQESYYFGSIYSHPYLLEVS